MTSNFRLVMVAGPNPGKIFELDQNSLFIGRDTNCHIVINDPETSRKHARLWLQSGAYMIEDLGSTNGTYINSLRLIGPHLLKHRETITLGDNVELAFEQLQFDPDATLASTYSPQGVPTSPKEVFESESPGPQQVTPAPQQSGYSGQVPPVPVQAYRPDEFGGVYPPVEEKKKPKTCLMFGGGCLLVLLLVLIGAAIVFDQLNLYCTPPFNLLFNCP